MVGTCYLVTDHQMALNCASQSRVVSVTEGNPFGNTIQVVEASILMPPYQAMVAQIDGNMEKFSQEYLAYLSSSESVNSLIAIIGRALLQGINITLFIPKDEAQLFANILLEYIMGAFGIVVGLENRQFCMMAFTPTKVSACCYIADVISLGEFLAEVPRDLNLFTAVASKVGIDCDLYYNVPKIVEYTTMLWDQQHLNGHLLERVSPIKVSADRP